MACAMVWRETGEDREKPLGWKIQKPDLKFRMFWFLLMVPAVVGSDPVLNTTVITPFHFSSFHLSTWSVDFAEVFSPSSHPSCFCLIELIDRVAQSTSRCACF